MRIDYRNAPIQADPSGYFYGPVAQGLALSAPLTLVNEACWNSLTDAGSMSDPEIRGTISDMWGIKDAEQWRSTLGDLADCDFGDWIADHATVVRTRTKARLDIPVLDDAAWSQALVEEVQRVGADPDYLAALHDRIPKIRFAEASLRTARLLGADEEVQALRGYDLVRAGNIARWGVRLGYGETHVVRTVALASRDNVVDVYSSWRDYGLGLTAARIVNFPDTFGRNLVDAIDMLRPLLDSVKSPWNNLPFPTERVLDEPEPAAENAPA